MSCWRGLPGRVSRIEVSMFAMKPRVIRAVCAFKVVTSHFAWQSFFFTYFFLLTTVYYSFHMSSDATDIRQCKMRYHASCSRDGHARNAHHMWEH